MSEKTYALFLTPANRKIISDLEKIGAKTVLFPVLKTYEITAATVELHDFLPDYDWLVFTDTYAVEFFLQKLHEDYFDLYDLDERRVCTYGEAVADALRFASIHTDVIPPKTGAADVYTALQNYIGAAEIGGLRFLILTGAGKPNALTDKLREAKAEAFELPIYGTEENDKAELTKLKTLLKGGAIDEFILTAPTDLIALENYFQSESLADVLAEIQISAADGVTFQTAREYDLRRVGLFRLDNVGKVI